MANDSSSGENQPESDLEATLSKLRTYRENDPNFEKAIAESAEAEVNYPDPLEASVKIIVKPKKGTSSDLPKTSSLLIEMNHDDDIYARISRAQAAHLRFLHDAMEKCFPTENVRSVLIDSHLSLLERNPDLQEPRNLKYLTEITESLPQRYASEEERAKVWGEIIDQVAQAGPHVGLLLQRKKDQFRVADAVKELPPETLRSMDKRSGSSSDPGRSDRTKA